LSDQSFTFDNELDAHEVQIPPFQISRTAVTNAEFAQFVDDLGYQRRDLWSQDGWRWRQRVNATHPLYWRRAGTQWLRRDFDRLGPLEDWLPVLHVNWFEAESYCRWAKRRLPTEAEWEMAASCEPSVHGVITGERKRRFPWGEETAAAARANLDWRAGGCIDVRLLPESDSAFGCRQMIGNAWEWTASDFDPYPGFKPGPYKEYSAPWFGDHKVLRGGCWTTRARMIHNAYRNFYKPDRRDVWAGFRTCSL
jgi:iron(II)-dependent oxidoreductase